MCIWRKICTLGMEWWKNRGLTRVWSFFRFSISIQKLCICLFSEPVVVILEIDQNIETRKMRNVTADERLPDLLQNLEGNFYFSVLTLTGIGIKPIFQLIYSLASDLGKKDFCIDLDHSINPSVNLSLWLSFLIRSSQIVVLFAHFQPKNSTFSIFSAIIPTF